MDKAYTMRASFRTLAAGQVRAYGPTIHRAEMLVEVLVDGLWCPIGGKEYRARFPHAETQKKVVLHQREGYIIFDPTIPPYSDLARGYAGWLKPGDTDYNWASPTLAYYRQTGAGTWEWETTMEYTG